MMINGCVCVLLYYSKMNVDNFPTPKPFVKKWRTRAGDPKTKESKRLSLMPLHDQPNVKKWMETLPPTLTRWFGGSPITSGDSEN
jgi:hypothetical protein